MLKKVILSTVVSLFVFSGFVAGPWGADLAEAFTKAQMDSLRNPNVQAIITISKGHKIEVLIYNGKKKPKESSGDREDQIDTPEDLPDVARPSKLKHEMPAGATKQTIIKVYGKNTCMQWNNTYYCW